MAKNKYGGINDMPSGWTKMDEEADGWAPDIDYSNIGWLLKGSWVEQYKSEIEEW